MESRNRILLMIAVAILIGASLKIDLLVRAIEEDIRFSSRLTSRTIDGNDRVEVFTSRSNLDRPMLVMEIPQRESEVTRLTPPVERGPWRQAIGWDFVFILGYVMLFVALPFTDSPPASVWENVKYMAVATALADCAENISILVVLHYLDQGQRLTGTRAFTVLPIFGVAKWVLFFLACRAVSIGYAAFHRWRLAAVVLSALVTAGTWSAVFSLAGLSARPVLGLVALLMSLLLVVVAVMRMRSDDPGPLTSDGGDFRVAEAFRERRDYPEAPMGGATPAGASS